MKLEVGPTGVTIDARDLAPLLDLPAAKVQGLMRDGKITSFYEKGEGADAGRFRVTFRHRGTRVRFTCDAAGAVLSQMRVKAGRDDTDVS